MQYIPLAGANRHLQGKARQERLKIFGVGRAGNALLRFSLFQLLG
jgi:hypothetical protein